MIEDRIYFRGDGPWGPGENRELTPPERDMSFWHLAERLRLFEIAGVPPQTVEAFEIDGDQFFVHLDQTSEPLGPFPLPYRAFRWRGRWFPGTAYDLRDLIHLRGFGLYLVLAAHTSQSTFDPDAFVGGQRLYSLLVELPPAGGIQIIRVASGGSYVLTAADRGALVLFPAGGTLTLPSHAQAPLPVGTLVAARQGGALPMVPVRAGGVALNPISGKVFETAHEGAFVYFRKVAANSWDSWGDWAAGELPSDFQPTEPAPTETETELSTEPVTQPATEEPSEPATEAPTEPATEEPAEPIDLLVNDTAEFTHTFNDVNFGEPAPNRGIVIDLGLQRAGGLGVVSMASVTIGGVAARRHNLRDASASHTAEIWSATVPEGTTGTVVFTLNSGGSDVNGAIAARVYRVPQMGTLYAVSRAMGAPDPSLLLAVPSGLGAATAVAFATASNEDPPLLELAGINVDTADFILRPGQSLRQRLSFGLDSDPPAPLSLTATASVLAASFKRGVFPSEFLVARRSSTVGATGTSFTTVMTGVPLGPASANRLIVLGYAMGASSSTIQLAEVRLTPNAGDPVILTRAVQAAPSNTSRNAEVWYGVVPEGTECDIAVRHTSTVRNINRHLVNVYSLPGVDPTPIATDDDMNNDGLAGEAAVSITAGPAFYVSVASVLQANAMLNLFGPDAIEGHSIAHGIPTMTGMIGSGFADGLVEFEAEACERLAVAAWDIGSIEIPHDPPTEEPTEPIIGDESELADHRAGVNFLHSSGANQWTAQLGAADSDRLIVAVVGWKNSSTDGQSQMTGLAIGATSLTRVARAIDGPANSNAEIWQAHMPSGTSGDVLASFDGHPGPNRNYSVALYRVVGLDGQYAPAAFLSDASSSDSVSDITEQENGLAIVGAFGGTNGNDVVGVHFGEGIVRDVPAHTASGFVNRSTAIARLHGTIGRAPTTGDPQSLGATAGSTPTGWAMRLAGAVWALPVHPTT